MTLSEPSQKITFYKKITKNKMTTFFHVTKTKTSGGGITRYKKKGEVRGGEKNLTINKTCVCDPHSLNISF